jgi:hypothetical protein
MNQKSIIVDLDGTLCNIDHRLKYIDGSLGKNDWDKFYENIPHDTLNEWCWNIVCGMLCGISHFFDPCDAVFITGRPERYTQQTLDWLYNTAEITDYGYSLFMRKNDDFRPAPEVKKDLYDEYIKDNYEIMFAIDDDPRVVEMWRNEGIVCLDCGG